MKGAFTMEHLRVGIYMHHVIFLLLDLQHIVGTNAGLTCSHSAAPPVVAQVRTASHTGLGAVRLPRFVRVSLARARRDRCCDACRSRTARLVWTMRLRTTRTQHRACPTCARWSRRGCARLHQPRRSGREGAGCRCGHACLHPDTLAQETIDLASATRPAADESERRVGGLGRGCAAARLLPRSSWGAWRAPHWCRLGVLLLCPLTARPLAARLPTMRLPAVRLLTARLPTARLPKARLPARLPAARPLAVRPLAMRPPAVRLPAVRLRAARPLAVRPLAVRLPAGPRQVVVHLAAARRAAARPFGRR